MRGAGRHRLVPGWELLLALTIGLVATGCRRETGVEAPGPDSDDPVLILETAPVRLRLTQGGALLREFRVASLERGEAEVFFVSLHREDPTGDSLPRLAGRTSRCEAVRMERVAPPVGGEAPEAVIPPDPAEACPMPHRLLLRFDRGPVLEIVPAADAGAQSRPSAVERFGWSLNDAFDAVLRPAPRWRLVIDADDAGALYRSLPDGVGLIVL